MISKCNTNAIKLISYDGKIFKKISVNMYIIPSVYVADVIC